MLHYIYKDMLSALQYLPAGLMLGLPLAGVLYFLIKKKGHADGARRVIPILLFGIYLGVILIITLFSREVGSRAGKEIELELFSSWGINDRNNAYVIENILLFIPYTFLYCWCYEKGRKFAAGFVLGAVTSLTIECIQLATARGVFQIDDILTNLLGAILGFWIFKLFCPNKRKRENQAVR